MTDTPRITDSEHHILWLVEQRLCMSLLDDRHPIVKALLDRGLLQKGEGGLRLTGSGHNAIGRITSVEDQP